ncbi:hypothetical protein AYI68_g7896 [Smittium mucronatum]|uniref:Uncharacterized protein n=1 Tax=Smittium mucronatum TaxID=133383 RepID=A0A1R0GMD7_9FUNG|nr:hypothetical protein AYI68_g7896 [Smittium mucronatum]
MPISFEVFPPKFGGKESECKSVNAWTTSFSDAVNYNECTAEQAVSLFKLWLHGEAAIWRLKLQDSATIRGWDLAEWLEQLKLHFVIEEEEQEGDLITFSRMRKGESQSWPEFNKEVLNYVARIPGGLYTETWLAKTYLEILARTDRDLWRSLKENSMLAVSSDLVELDNKNVDDSIAVLPTLTSEAINNKRMRLDYVTHPRTVVDLPPIGNRMGSAKTKIKKKKGKAGNKISQKDRDFTQRLLTAPAPMTLEESLIARPQALESVIQEFRKLKNKPKRQLYAEEENTLAINSFREIPCYLLLEHRGKALPIFVDTGATYSLISKELAKSLNLDSVELNNPIRIQPVKGKDITITTCCVLELKLDESLYVNMTFAILPDCAVPIILGLDNIITLNGRLRYDTSVMSVKVGEKRAKLQLLPKADVESEAEELNNETSEVESGTEVDSEESSDDESVGLFYATQFEEYTSPETNPLESTENYIPEELNNVISKFSQLFPNSIKELKTIRNSEFRIIIPKEESPPRCGMRRLHLRGYHQYS